jgi:hypothetical protein
LLSSLAAVLFRFCLADRADWMFVAFIESAGEKRLLTPTPAGVSAFRYTLLEKSDSIAYIALIISIRHPPHLHPLLFSD